MMDKQPTTKAAKPKKPTRDELLATANNATETLERVRGEMAAEIVDLRKQLETERVQHTQTLTAAGTSAQKADENNRREIATLLRIDMDPGPSTMGYTARYTSAGTEKPVPSWFQIAHAIGRVMAQRDAYSELRAEALAAQSLTNVANHA